MYITLLELGIYITFLGTVCEAYSWSTKKAKRRYKLRRATFYLCFVGAFLTTSTLIYNLITDDLIKDFLYSLVIPVVSIICGWFWVCRNWKFSFVYEVLRYKRIWMD